MTKPLALLACALLAAACEKEAPAPGASATPAAPATRDRIMPSEVEQMREASKHAEAEAEKARAALEAAHKAAREAQTEVERLEKSTSELIDELNRAISTVMAAQSDAERAAGKERLVALQKQQAELQALIAAAKATAAKAERQLGKKLPQECLDNPLAAGCQ
jgi:DNA repair exonuclease SbcCD ATPase subunit